MTKLRATGEISRIPSKVYFELFDKGGDPLVALFCILKRSKTCEKYLSYTNSRGGKVGGYGLLRKNTNLSLNTLKKYVPLLVELELLEFKVNGDVYLKGTNKLIEEYKNRKLLPVKVGKSFKSTQYNSAIIRFYSCRDNQLKAIDKKNNQNEKYLQGAEPKNYQDYQKYKDIQKGKLKKVAVIDTVILSNEGVSRIKAKSTGKHQKSRGSYWKSKFVDLGLLEFRRRFKKVKKMSLKEFKHFRANGTVLNVNKFKYQNGWLVEEVCSEMSIKESDKEEKVVKGKPIGMGFDFLGWLEDNPEVNIDTYKSLQHKKV